MGLDPFRVAPVEAHRPTWSGDKRIQRLIQEIDNVSVEKDIPYRTVLKELNQLQQAFIRQHEQYWWDGGKGKVWNQPKVALLKSAGAFVNFVAQDSVALAPSILGVNKGLFYCSKCKVFLESDKEANKHKSKCNTELDPVSPLVSPSDFKDLVAVDFCLQELSTLAVICI